MFEEVSEEFSKLQDGSGNNNNPELIPVIENVREFNRNPFRSTDVSDVEFDEILL